MDFLQAGLSDDAKRMWRHRETKGWHPPLAIPRWKEYAPSADILGEMPERDQSWTEPQTFNPTLEEFADFTKYIAHMEAQGAAQAGIAKIVVPDEWAPRKIGYNPADMDEIMIRPIRQNITLFNVNGVFKTIADRSYPMITVDEY